MCRALLTALIVAACLTVPAVADANGSTTLKNQRADRVALSSYSTYLQELVAEKPAAKLAEQAFAATTTSTCNKALTTIANMSSVPAGSTSALTNIGEEIGADADLEFLLTSATPFAQLQAGMAAVRWGTATPALAVSRYLAAETALLALKPSNLCGDALDVAAEAGQPPVSTPAATTAFLSTYELDVSTANARLAAFLKMFQTYETPSDAALVTKINTLVTKLTTISAISVKQGTVLLCVALGVPKLAG